uniref:carbonic anhydrase n=1 Tax=Dugesia japonica TaxID=6161 RepID=A0A0G4DC04_DUGJA|nr:carbonic anhydrase [Dugesia japonica]
MCVTGVPGYKNDLFKLVQFHFHWGNTETGEGSEHQINGKSWPSELHLVHYNSTKYSSLSEAANEKDGLLVLGVMIQTSGKNMDFQNFIQCIETIRENSRINLHEKNAYLNLNNLLPNNTDRYFTYSGSLTTPPCNESVIWIVFEYPITMSQEQILQFQKVHCEDDCETSANYRPVCPINDRKVKRSFK